MEIRSRFVAREMKWQQLMDDVFSATPPTIAILFLLSLAMTTLPWIPLTAILKIMLLDISRAHFHSPATREVYVNLPPERHVAGYCARLLQSLYGTRDAGANFQRLIISILEHMSFIIGKFSPCLAHHLRSFVDFYSLHFLRITRRDFDFSGPLLSRRPGGLWAVVGKVQCGELRGKCRQSCR